MAKYEKRFKGNIDNFLNYLEDNMQNAGASITYEDGTDTSIGNCRMNVMVYERYSMIGGNRVSLNISILSGEEEIFVSVIASGGSQAVLFKLNTLGEESFLEKCKEIIDKYINKLDRM